MIKRIRIALATVFFVGLLLMFLDFTGTMHCYLSWMAKLQFWPALTSATLVGAVCAVIVIVLTLVFGRIYCSVICPLGVMQDIIAKIGRLGRRNPYSYSKEKKWLRYGFLVIMLALVPFGLSSILAPYSAFGRIANTLFRPLWVWGNNLLAGLAESADSYLFYDADVLLTGGVTIGVAIATLAVVGVFAAKNGRTYCNTVCPVGTILSFFSRHSYLKLNIDADKCKNCGKCAKNCKAGCIDFKNHTIDHSRCVVCGDCLEQCEFLAIEYGHATKDGFNTVARGLKPTRKQEERIAKKYEQKQETSQTDTSRRSFLLTMAMATTAATLAQDKKKVDGGLAAIEDKQAPKRKTTILPPGAVDMKHMSLHCTACQLCVSACPNKVLRPSTSLDHFMQPVMSYEHGYCRPECHACSDVCPAGAIHKIGAEVKVSTKIGTAVVLTKNCIAYAGDAECGNCERHCPTGAITMVPSDPEDEQSVKMPTVDETRCIGCGACENLCPSRPFSAIYVEGIEKQREI